MSRQLFMKIFPNQRHLCATAVQGIGKTNAYLLLKECFHLYADNSTINKLSSSAHNLN